MRDNELFKLLRDVMLSGLSRYGLTDVSVKQAYQTLPVGPDYAKTLYVSKISELRDGFVIRSDTYDLDTDDFIHTETQIVESVIQFNGWVIVEADNFDGITAADLTNYAAEILNSDTARKQLLDANASILRISNIRVPYFLDDRDRFEASPSFDVSVMHSNTRLSTTPPVNTINSGLYRI